jgi:hypothetical protein
MRDRDWRWVRRAYWLSYRLSSLVLERGDDAHQLVPLLDDEVEIDHTAQRRAERAVIGVAAARLCGRGCSLRTMLAPA